MSKHGASVLKLCVILHTSEYALNVIIARETPDQPYDDPVPALMPVATLKHAMDIAGTNLATQLLLSGENPLHSLLVSRQLPCCHPGHMHHGMAPFVCGRVYAWAHIWMQKIHCAQFELAKSACRRQKPVLHSRTHAGLLDCPARARPLRSVRQAGG